MGCCGGKEKEKQKNEGVVVVHQEITIIQQVSQEDVLRAKLEAAFEAADKNKDGVLDRREFKAMLHDAGFTATDEDMKLLFDQADQDKSDNLDFREFVIFFLELSMKIKLMMALRNLFEEMDEHKTGQIHPSKLKSFFKEKGLLNDVPDDTFDQLIKQCDLDHNGKISYEEFISFFSELVEKEMS